MSEYSHDRGFCGPNEGPGAMSIHTRKITDACRDKDCIEDLRVYLTRGSQEVLETATCVKVRKAELLYTSIDVEQVAFDRKHYCIDVTFYYRIFADATVGTCRPAALYGLSVFSKRAVLCGEESKTHIFSSTARLGCGNGPAIRQANLPTAVVEVLDPMVLQSKVKDGSHCHDNLTVQIPDQIRQMFDDELVTQTDRRKLYVTLGQFSLIRLEREAQLVVPVLDYSIPCKECCDAPGCGEDPCEMFSRIPFPEGQFVPRDCDRDPGCECPLG